MTSLDTTGYALISVLDNGGEYRVPRQEYGRVLAQWQAGAAFLHFTTMDGATVTLKGARVEAIADMPAEALEAWKDRRRAERREEEREI